MSGERPYEGRGGREESPQAPHGRSGVDAGAEIPTIMTRERGRGRLRRAPLRERRPQSPLPAGEGAGRLVLGALPPEADAARRRGRGPTRGGGPAPDADGRRSFLGWTRIREKGFVVRQWSDHKGAVKIAKLSSETLEDYAALCGEVLAKAHVRTGDGAMLAGYCGRGEQLDAAIARRQRGQRSGHGPQRPGRRSVRPVQRSRSLPCRRQRRRSRRGTAARTSRSLEAKRARCRSSSEAELRALLALFDSTASPLIGPAREFVTASSPCG